MSINVAINGGATVDASTVHVALDGSHVVTDEEAATWGSSAAT
jgi:hypothetical protein